MWGLAGVPVSLFSPRTAFGLCGSHPTGASSVPHIGGLWAGPEPPDPVICPPYGSPLPHHRAQPNPRPQPVQNSLQFIYWSVCERMNSGFSRPRPQKAGPWSKPLCCTQPQAQGPRHGTSVGQPEKKARGKRVTWTRRHGTTAVTLQQRSLPWGPSVFVSWMLADAFTDGMVSVNYFEINASTKESGWKAGNR